LYAVVADDAVDQRVVEHLEFAQRFDQTPDMVVGVLHEPGVDLHLAGEHRLQVVGHVLPGRNLGRAGGQLGVGRNHPQLLLAGEGAFAQRIPAVVETALVPVGPFSGHMVRRMCGARRVVDEERLVRHERLLLPDPLDRPVGHVVGEVVALLRRAVGLDGDGVAVDCRRVLVSLAPDEPVEVLETIARAGPAVERSHRAGLPDRDLVALAEVGGRIPVQLERLGERRLVLRPQRAVSGRRCRDLGDPAHPHRVVVASAQQRRSRREQSAVVWNRVYLRPSAASRSNVGVLHGPPKALDAP
jgi:hypothetical protein